MIGGGGGVWRSDLVYSYINCEEAASGGGRRIIPEVGRK